MRTTKHLYVDVRWMVREDTPAVVDIDSEGWTEEDFCNRLAKRNCIGMVAVTKANVVVGFVVYLLHKYSIEIQNMGVAKLRRRIGTAIICRLAAKLGYAGRSRITAIVRDSNLTAQLFFRTKGFLATEVHRGYYDDGSDGYLFEFELPPQPDPMLFV